MTSRSGPTVYGAISLLVICTGLGKLLAFVRDVLTANYYGASIVTDAFYGAMMIPSILVPAIGLSLSSAIVPLSSGIEAKGGTEGVARFHLRVAKTVLIGAAALSLVLYFSAPLIVKWSIAGLGEKTRYEAIHSLHWLSFWTGGSVLFIALSGMFQSRKRFLPPALFELLNTAGVIGALVIAANAGMDDALPFSWAVGATIMVVGLAAVFVFRLRPATSGAPPASGLKDLALLTAPIMVATGLISLHFAVDRAFASRLPVGNVAALGYAFVLITIPINLLILPATTAVFPFLSRIAQEGNREGLAQAMRKMVRVTVLLLLPASVALYLAAEAVVSIVYHRGAFDATDLELTSAALRGFTPTLIPLALITVLTRVFYAVKDAMSVVVCVVVGLAVKIAGTMILPADHGVGDLTLTTSIGAAATLLLMLALVGKRTGIRPDAPLGRSIASALAAAAMAAAAVWGAERLGLSPASLAGALLFTGLYGFIYLILYPSEGARALRLVSSFRRPSPPSGDDPEGKL